MASFDTAKMSADEWQFIHTYCRTLQKEYYMLQTILGLMAPKGLHIKCALEATSKAGKLYELQTEYCKKIEQLGGVTEETREPVKPALLANIFVASFFKLVDSETKKVFITDKGLPAHDGWSSGHPADWQQTIHSLQQLHEQNSAEGKTKHGTLLGIILNLFLSGPKHDKPAADAYEHTATNADTFEASPDYDYEEEYEEEYSEDDDSDYDGDISSFM
jgi:hypothetical protein